MVTLGNTLHHFGLMKSIDSDVAGTISDKWEMAKKLGYPFYSWNDRIYNTSDNSDTGLVMKQILLVT